MLIESEDNKKAYESIQKNVMITLIDTELTLVSSVLENMETTFTVYGIRLSKHDPTVLK